MLNISFAPESLSAIAQMLGFEALLSIEMGTAMKEGGDLIPAAPKANTQTAFQNPTGALSESIVPVLTSPYELQIGVGVPYGRRRELGGGGLSDSLGRPMNDPAEPYLEP